MLTLHLDEGRSGIHLCTGTAIDPLITIVGTLMLVYTVLVIDDEFSYEVSGCNYNTDD